jgi:hypothetical protein
MILAGPAGGGLFGYYGLFRPGSSKLPLVHQPRQSDCRRNGRQTALFADDTDGFLNTIRASTPVMPGERRAEKGGAFIVRWISAAVGAVVALCYSACIRAGSPGYTLTPTALSIHDRFYPSPCRPPWDGSTSGSSTSAKKRLGPTPATNGFSNRHHHSGVGTACQRRPVFMNRLTAEWSCPAQGRWRSRALWSRGAGELRGGSAQEWPSVNM